MQDEKTINAFFKYKSHVFKASFDKLNADILMENLQQYRKKKADERSAIIKQLYMRIDNLYADEKIKPEKLQEYTQGLVVALKKTSVIDHF